ncbi:SurA N-terminal domain-containing protein [Verrucomicrobiota bacterium sgz303538]
MVNLIRRFQQPLMIIITIIVIIAFAWLYNSSSRLGRVGRDRVGTIYGRNVTQTEFVRAAKKFELARDLQLFDMLEALVGPAMTLDQATENYVWNSMVLRHEADRMGIKPTDSEVEEFVKGMRVFQNNGQYDSSRYIAFVQNALSPRGFTEEQLFEVIRDNLGLRKIKDVLGSTTAPAPAEVRSIYEQGHQKTEASVIRLKLDDFLKNVQVSEEDLKKTFEERKATLNTQEKRKVKFVAFTLANQEKPLVGKERMEALQKLSDRAGEFAVAMTEKNAKFEDVAAKFNVPVQQSPEFTVEDAPQEFGQSEQVVGAAFRLTKEDPNSDAVSGDNGYYVLQLADIAPARPLTYEEAKPKLEEQIKRERAQEAMNLKATEIRNKIDAELKAGKPFAEAAQAAGVTPEAFPAFSLVEPKFDQPDAREVISRSAELQVGQLSEFIPTAAGGDLVYINNRQPVDEKAFEKDKSQIEERIAQSRREALFREWMKNRRAEANVQVARA